MKLTRAVLGLSAGLLGAVLLPGTPAWAHSQLRHTAPVDGGTVTTVTSTVTLTFNEMVRQRFSTVVVTAADGTNYSDGHLKVVDDNVFQPVYPLPSGSFRVAWRMISADGHPVQGQFRFTVALPPDEEPTIHPPTHSQASGVPTGHPRSSRWWIGGGVAVVGFAVGAVALAGRRRAGAPR